MARLRPILTGLALTVALVALPAASSDAARPATAPEVAAIAPAVGVPAACITASVSDVDPTWATAQDTNAGTCPPADGTVIVHLTATGWQQVTAGSAFGFCPVDGVPPAVAAEFALCRTVTPASYVLGAAAYAPEGVGFGERRPHRISNGGEPSGLASHITWRHWGSARATGVGRTAIFHASTGYEDRLVRIELRATRRGRCDDSPAYMHLEYRMPSRPGGRLGPWRSWSGSASICDAP